MADQLILTGIQVEALIGLLAEERKARQGLVVSVTLEIDFVPAADADSLASIVNYADVVAAVREFASQFSDNTLERFAHRLALALRGSFPQCTRASVRVAKPRYTGPLGLESIEVYVER